MGPHRIRQVALWLGRTTAQLQAISRGFARQLNAELDAVDQGGDVRSAMNEVQELRRQIKDLRREITGAAISPLQESKEMLRESREILHNSIAPPKTTQNTQDMTSSADPANADKADEATTQTLPRPLDIPDDPE